MKRYTLKRLGPGLVAILEDRDGMFCLALDAIKSEETAAAEVARLREEINKREAEIVRAFGKKSTSETTR